MKSLRNAVALTAIYCLTLPVAFAQGKGPPNGVPPGPPSGVPPGPPIGINPGPPGPTVPEIDGPLLIQGIALVAVLAVFLAKKR